MSPCILYANFNDYDSTKYSILSKYLYSLGYDIRPARIIKKNFPNNITILPTIYVNNIYVHGINEIMAFYEDFYCTDELWDKAIDYHQRYPNQKI